MSAVLEQCIVETLLADSATVELIGKRVRPLYGDQLDARPFITYMSGDEENKPTNNGPSLHSQTQIEFGIIGDTASQVVAVAAELKRIWSSTKVIGTQVTVSASLFVDQSDIEEQLVPGTGIPLFVRQVLFKMIWRVNS